MSNIEERVQPARTLAMRLFLIGVLGIAALLAFGRTARAADDAEHDSAFSEAVSAEHGADSEPGAVGSHSEGEGSGHGHTPHWNDINWVYGLVGEREGVEPDLFFRPVGMPPPFLATFLNSAVLFGILIYFGRRPVGEMLRKRKEEIMRGIADSARMKEEAERQFADYEAQLAGMQERVDKARQEIRQAGEQERERVVSEAKQRRERMEREAHRFVEQELETARLALTHRVVRAAAARAERMLAAQVTSQDQRRLADAYLSDVNGVAGVPGVQP